MKYYSALSEADLAQHYVQAKGSIDYLPNSAAALVADVESYLRANRLEHRLNEAAAIADEAYRIVQQVRQQQAPAAEQAVQDNVLFGYGDQRPDLDELAMRRADEIALTTTLRNTSMADWHEMRVRLGVAPKSQFDHLAGSFGN